MVFRAVKEFTAIMSAETLIFQRQHFAKSQIFTRYLLIIFWAEQIILNLISKGKF